MYLHIYTRGENSPRFYKCHHRKKIAEICAQNCEPREGQSVVGAGADGAGADGAGAVNCNISSGYKEQRQRQIRN